MSLSTYMYVHHTLTHLKSRLKATITFRTYCLSLYDYGIHLSIKCESFEQFSLNSLKVSFELRFV